MTIPSPFIRLLTVRVPTSGIASMAFNVRFTNTCESMLPSHATSGSDGESSFTMDIFFAFLSYWIRFIDVSIISFI